MSLVCTIIGAVADREGVNPTELPPLHQSIDPDALGLLVESPLDGDDYAEFSYSGHAVCVSGDGGVSVDRLEDHPILLS